MRAALVPAGWVVAAPGLLASAHIGALALASAFYRPDRPEVGAARQLRFVVVIPAHDEERVIGETLRSLRDSMHDGDAVVVVADRCTDATAQIAREHGAIVVETDPSAPGGRARARQAGLERALATEGWDALVTLDADCIVDPGFLPALDAALATGAPAAQARLDGDDAPGVLARVTEVAFGLQGVLLQRGRDRLGLAVRLRGPGAAVRRGAIEGHGYRSPAGSEDLWLCFDLLLDGVVARYVDGAVVRTGGPTGLAAATRQRIRWESGRLVQAREFLPPLLRRRSAANLEAAVNLATPPLAVAVASVSAGGALGLLGRSSRLVAAAAGGLGAITGAVLMTLVETKARPRTWAALLVAPAYVVWKLVIQVVSVLGLKRRGSWDTPTPRG